jgi:ribose/xylose/arabinose/galactoside ABC-type transport system permease subunit
MTPLNWADITEALVVVWVITFIATLVEVHIVRGKGRLAGSLLSYAFTRWMAMGSLFTIFGIAQSLRNRGLIALDMQLFIMFVAAACAAYSVRASALVRRTEDTGKNPQP